MASTVATDEKGMPLSPGAINGALMERGNGVEYPIPCIKVQFIDKAMAAIKKAGGKILMGKQAVGDMGLYTRFQDPDGDILSLWQDVR